MHGEKETGNSARVVCTLIHAILLALAIWIYFGSIVSIVSIWIGIEYTGSMVYARKSILTAFGMVLFLRILFVHLYLLKRKFGWEELGGVVMALIIYQVGFAFLSFGSTGSIDIVDYIGIALFIIGSYLNTGSEIQRKRFKDDPSHAGRLYTGGLFKYVRHINYFGDILWVTGWAVLTRNWWSALIPLGLTAGFVFFFIPPLTDYLREHYKDQFSEWKEDSKALIPFIY